MPSPVEKLSWFWVFVFAVGGGLFIGWATDGFPKCFTRECARRENIREKSIERYYDEQERQLRREGYL